MRSERSSTQTMRYFQGGMKLNQLRVLVGLWKLKQVQRVADALHVTQPAISRQLRELEEAVGIPLFDRSGNRITLTLIGQRFAQRADQILQQVANVELEVEAMAAGLAGHVTIGTVATAAHALVPDAILKLRVVAPQVLVRIVEDSADELFSMLEEGSIDIAVVRLPEERYSASVNASLLLFDPLVPCCGVRHGLLQGATSLDWDDLREFEWVVPAPGSPARLAFNEFMIAKGLPVLAAVESISMSANVALMEANELIGLLPLSIAKRLDAEHKLAIVPVPIEPLLAQVSAHWQEKTKPVTEIMLRCLEEVSQSYQ